MLTTEEGRGKLSKVPADGADAQMRIYVLYGQYGWTTSSGMYYLAQSLARYGEVSVHQWDDRTIVPDARRHSGKIVIIGYSLGANTMVAIANKLPHVDLIVAYDPSRLSPLTYAANGEFTQQVAPTVRRAICFLQSLRLVFWWWAARRISGRNCSHQQLSSCSGSGSAPPRDHRRGSEAACCYAAGAGSACTFRNLTAPERGCDEI